MGAYGTALDAYLTGRLTGRELAAMEAHVSNCLFVTEWTAELNLRSVDWERRGLLGRLVRLDRDAVEAAPAAAISA
jgi:hypothetical protein